MKINAGNIKKGEFLLHNGEVWQVVKAEFYSPGKGAALMRTNLKNVKTGKTLGLTFKSGESVEIMEVETKKLQYLYKDESFIYLMDPKNFEQYQLSLEAVDTLINFLKEGEILRVLLYEDQPISIRPPKSVQLKVVEAEVGVKGDTVTSPRKSVTVETGLKVLVPLAIKKGDVIAVNPETREYIERVSVGK